MHAYDNIGCQLDAFVEIYTDTIGCCLNIFICWNVSRYFFKFLAGNRSMLEAGLGLWFMQPSFYSLSCVIYIMNIVVVISAMDKNLSLFLDGIRA